jgi:hypothetical protein
MARAVRLAVSGNSGKNKHKAGGLCPPGEGGASANLPNMSGSVMHTGGTMPVLRQVASYYCLRKLTLGA